MVLLTYCGGASSGPVLKWSQLEANCSTSAEDYTVISVSDNTIIFSGEVSADPCATVTSEFRQDDTVLSINFTSTVPDGACIECLGSIHFGGTISNLTSGDYTVQIIHQGAIVISQSVSVNN